MDEDKRIQYGSASGHLKEHISWSHMVNRCLNKNNDNYDYYGGRGVTICDRWLGENGFANFLNDMGNRPEGGSLERVDPNGNYEPGNCRWATKSDQAFNRRDRKNISGIRGVSIHSNKDGSLIYVANICKNYRQYWKCVKDLESAKQWRKQKELELYGFAPGGKMVK